MTDMPEYPESLDLNSSSISEDRIQQLKQVVPEAFTEDGYIDFDKLKTTLGEHVDEQEERFGLQWPGKRDCFKVIQEPAKGTLQPAPEESEDWANTENLFIEGDNLEVLKLLQKSYYGKVKMIYIDPPYNTGNEFIYPDDYKENLNTYLAYTGQVNEEGYKFSTNTETEGRYHSNWLNMMYLRLFMARNLLKDDGVIFISIDDHEVANLKLACNEIFGEENFITQIIVKSNPRGSQSVKQVGVTHEYLLVYGKYSSEIPILGVSLDENLREEYNKKDTDGYRYRLLGLRQRGGSWRKEDRPYLYYPLFVDPNNETISLNKDEYHTIEVYPIKPSTNEEGTWRWNKEKIQNNIDKIIPRKVKRGDEIIYDIYQKDYLVDKNGEEKLTKIKTIWDEKEVNYQNGTTELKELFGGKEIFSFPKPIFLLQKIIESVRCDKNDIVLDFFAGSSVTAHAVFKQNILDGLNRKFIMIQLPEYTETKSIAYQEGYTTIAEIGKEQIKRAIGKLKENQKYNTNKNSDLFEAKSDEIKPISLDLGFRVFKLDESNFKEWEGTAKDQPVEEQLKLNVDHVRSGSSEEQMLYEILLKSGYPLTVPIDTLELANKKVYSIVDSTMLICLEDALDEAVIVAMAEKKPNKVVVLDKGFNGQDELKTNAVQIMKSHGVEDFRTV